MKKRLTIAKYKENTSWVSSISTVDEILIYDKSTNIVKNYDDVVDGTTNIKYLYNIGRESHTYLTHIIKNYDSLFDVEIFAQGRISDHIRIDLFNDLINNTESIENNGFQDFSPTRKYLCWNESDFDTVKSKYPNSIHVGVYENSHLGVYDILYGDKPKKDIYVELGAHGIFAVTKNTILKHEKSKYIKMLDFFNIKTRTDFELIHYAYVYEHFWKVIFTE